MSVSFKAIQQALGEWDFAMRASSYGHMGDRHLLAEAIKNLPTEELERLRPILGNLIKDAVARTTSKIQEIGVVMDVAHPPGIRATLDVGSYFYKKDRE